jgi:hypothetical protein
MLTSAELDFASINLNAFKQIAPSVHDIAHGQAAHNVKQNQWYDFSVVSHCEYASLPGGMLDQKRAL